MKKTYEQIEIEIKKLKLEQKKIEAEETKELVQKHLNRNKKIIINKMLKNYHNLKIKPIKIETISDKKLSCIKLDIHIHNSKLLKNETFLIDLKKQLSHILYDQLYAAYVYYIKASRIKPVIHIKLDMA